MSQTIRLYFVPITSHLSSLTSGSKVIFDYADNQTEEKKQALNLPLCILALAKQFLR